MACLGGKGNLPMIETEMVKLFIDTQEAPYYEKLTSAIGKSYNKQKL